MFAVLLIVLLAVGINAHNFVPSDIEKLSKQIDGSILNRNSSDYQEAIRIFDFRFIKYPDYIFECTTPDDVQKVYKFLLEFDEQFVIRAGGHSVAGYSTCNGCSIIDLHHLDTIIINEDEETVTVGTGIHAHELMFALEKNEQNDKKWWVTLGVDNPGIGGHVHGGGWGIGIRKYGLLTDNLLEAKVITYKQNTNGKYITNIKTASNEENSDLFFCIRGVGGPSCGIVIEYKLKIYQQKDNFLYAENNFIINKMESVLEIQQMLVDHSLSDQIGFEAFVSVQIIGNPFIPDQPLLLCRFVGIWYDFDNINEGIIYLNNNVLNIDVDNATSIKTFYDQGTWARIRCWYQAFTTQQCQSFNDDFTLAPKVRGSNGHSYSETQFSWLVSSEESYDDFITNGGFDYLYLQITTKCAPITDFSVISFCGWHLGSWGGAVSNIASDATGFPHRNTKFDFNLVGIWHENLFEQYGKDMLPIMNSIWQFWMEQELIEKRVYVNYLNPQLPQNEYLDYYYDTNKNKLIQLKCKWDPKNVLTNPQGLIQAEQQCLQNEKVKKNNGANSLINDENENTNGIESLPSSHANMSSYLRNKILIIIVIGVVIILCTISGLLYLFKTFYVKKKHQHNNNVNKMEKEVNDISQGIKIQKVDATNSNDSGCNGEKVHVF
eukprot:256677_1